MYVSFMQGDSGFLIYRQGRIVLSSAPQQDGFNCPFQLSARANSNTVWEADVDNFRVQPGDIIVLGKWSC
jgi:hypothetical protein